MDSLLALAQKLENGEVASIELVERSLAAIAAPDGEGTRAFMHVDATQARDAAACADRRRRAGTAPSPFCGIPISIKDLFDVHGEVAQAGSIALGESPPASGDATAIARLRRAGFVFIGRTNMTEFAYSGLGLNPHYGTPLNPYDRRARRIPGGSSSGAAVSVADGMAAAGIGTDTGGSCRIPAALCGIVGYKPTAARIPLDGVVPLAPSLDSVGALARTVGCCAILDAVMSGARPQPRTVTSGSRGIALGVPRQLVLDDLDDTVAAAFERTLAQLRSGDIAVVDVDFHALAMLPHINAKGGLAAAEAFAWHRRMLAEHGAKYDRRVSARILKGAEQSAVDYIDVLSARRDVIAQAQRAMADFDALVYPTVPIVAPRLDELADDDDYVRLNTLVLRNASVANFLDTCAISIPVQRPGEPPVGINVLGHAGQDDTLFAIAARLERALAVHA